MSNLQRSAALPRAELVQLYRQALATGAPVADIDKKVERLAARQQVSEQIEVQDQQQIITNIKRRVPWYMRWGAMGVPVVLMIVGVWLVGLTSSQIYMIQS